MNDRLDTYLVKTGYYDSREKAKNGILSGNVFINDIKTVKPGIILKKEPQVRIEENEGYVSRGGYKIEKAFKEFKIDVNGKTAVDIGISTGGFSDCMLRNGVLKIYGIDVGKGVVDWKLRNNEKLEIFEGVNAKYFDIGLIREKIDIITIDLAFISVLKVIKNFKPLIDSHTCIIILIKPQFETDRETASKFQGVIRGKDVIKTILVDFVNGMKNQGLFIHKLTFSPIKGKSGNIEYLGCFRNFGPDSNIDTRLILSVVEKSQQVLLDMKN